jgi:hypothetical protein
MLSLQNERESELEDINNVLGELQRIVNNPDEHALLPPSYGGSGINSSGHEEEEKEELQFDLAKSDKKGVKTGGTAELANISDVNNRIKKKMNKGLKGSELGKDKDFREEMGANAQQADFSQQENIKSKVDEIRARRAKLSMKAENDGQKMNTTELMR